MKISKHVILTSLMGLLVSTAYTMDQNAENALAGQHAAAQIQKISTSSDLNSTFLARALEIR